MYLLRVHTASDEPPAEEPALALYRLADEQLELVASHDCGVSLADIQGVAPSAILTSRPDGKSQKLWLREAGMALYEQLAQGAIEPALRAATGAPVALDLRSPELFLVPWEIMRRRGTVGPLFADPGAPWLCGAAPEPLSTTPVADEWPLRMLVVVGSAPDDTAVQAKEESYALEALARGGPTGTADERGGGPRMRTRSDLLLSTLFQPTLDQIARELQEFQPHIFHFIGHGRIRKGEPELRVFASDDSSYHPWGYDQITTAFDLDAVPRLVYLDACHSGFDDPTSWSLTQAFRDIGASAVIAMQREILGSTAVECARRFYGNLLAGDSVARALSGVRRSLMAGDHSSEWYVPRLWVRGRPADSITVTSSPSPSARADLFRCPTVDQRSCFVGRWPQRYDAWRELDAAEEAGLLVVRGPRETGRTSFVQLLMETHALAGWTIHYVDFRGIAGDYLTVLDRILAVRSDPDHCSYIRAPLDVAGFQGFLDARPKGSAREDKALVGNMRKRLMTGFWNGLRASARQQPLCLVLDHLQGEHLHQDVVAKHLAYEFLHVHRPPDTRAAVRALVVLDNKQARAVARQPFHRDPPQIELSEFSAQERDYYMPLYFSWKQLADPAAAQRMQKFIVDFQIPCPAGFERAEGLLSLVRRSET